MPRKRSKSDPPATPRGRAKSKAAVTDYRHDEAKRKNNPEVGLANFEPKKRQPRQKYEYDPKLGFSIPYDFAGQTHQYEPDFIVRLRRDDGSVLNLVLEVKGQSDNRTGAKEAGARRWIDAVNNWGRLGQWQYQVVKELTRLDGTLSSLS